MRHLIIAISVMVVLGLGAGCGTICMREFPSLRTKQDDSTGPYYRATKMDLYVIVEGCTPGGEMASLERPMYFFGGILDLPFSLITDTLLFPLDLVRGLTRPEPITFPPFTLSRTNPENRDNAVRLLEINDGSVLFQEGSSPGRIQLKEGEAIPILLSNNQILRVLSISQKKGEVIFRKEERR